MIGNETFVCCSLDILPCRIELHRRTAFAELDGLVQIQTCGFRLIGVWVCDSLLRRKHTTYFYYRVAAFYLAAHKLYSGSELPIANLVTGITVRTRKRI